MPASLESEAARVGCDDGLKASGETGVKNTESELNTWVWNGAQGRGGAVKVSPH